MTKKKTPSVEWVQLFGGVNDGVDFPLPHDWPEDGIEYYSKDGDRYKLDDIERRVREDGSVYLELQYHLVREPHPA